MPTASRARAGCLAIIRRLRFGRGDDGGGGGGAKEEAEGEGGGGDGEVILGAADDEGAGGHILARWGRLADLPGGWVRAGSDWP